MIVINNDTRQYNLKESTKDSLVTLRVVPGRNEVEKEVLDFFKSNAQLKGLVEDGLFVLKDGSGKDIRKATVTKNNKAK